MNDREHHQRYLSDRTTAWLLEYFLISTHPEEGGIHIPSAVAATEITGVIAPQREALQITARAWASDVREGHFAKAGDTSKLPYIRNGRPTA